MSKAPSVRAEAAHLRTFRRNTLSFTSIDNRACTRFHLPPPVKGDFWANHVAGARMALELIEALRADAGGNSLMYLVHKLAPLWEDSAMRNAFFEILELAIIDGPSVEALANADYARSRRSFSAPPHVGAPS